MFKRVAIVLILAALPLRASALDTKDLLALVAMPLAVAAVSEVTDVPMNDLIDAITLMNQADVPPAQFIEVVRYAPAVPDLDDVLRARIAEGVTGPALFPAIQAKFVASGVPDVNVVAPREVTVVDNTFVPVTVRTRIARAHPHGGPPGQLKKELGVQTGAEIVHGSHPGRGHGHGHGHGKKDAAVVIAQPREVEVEVHREHGKGEGHDDGKGKGEDHGHGGEGGGHGHGGGHGKGKG
jgi:hypothetical protein